MIKIEIKVSYRLLKKDNKLTARLSAEHWKYIQFLMGKHEDFNISNVLRRILDGCIDLNKQGLDLYDKTELRKIITIIQK